ncbi:MAG: CAP domain-containing protein [Planctomycetia bacterium]|nr:CAP domain-containing protein [Planctomycetia bacterium]
MNFTTRATVTTLLLVSLAEAGLGQEPPTKQWVWLDKQGVWGYGYQLQDGPHRGLWRVDPETKRPPEDAEPAADPYGFAAILNAHRASAGLPPLAYDHDLSTWAARNNAEQASRGLGHHVNPNCYQNSCWNAPDAQATSEEWMNSPAHRANMLSPNVSRFGIAYGPGPYWTMNAQ